MANAYRDENNVPTLIASSNVDGKTPVRLYADPVTHRLLTDLSGIDSHFVVDQFTSTNNQTAFTATNTVVSSLLFIVNGVVQAPGISYDYTVSGSTVTLNAGIPAGLQVQWLYIK